MATIVRRRSIASSLDQSSRDQSLAAPVDKALSKSTSASALSVSSDGPGDSYDGAFDRLRSHNSDDSRSDSSLNHHRRLSGLFKRKKARKNGSRDNMSQIDPTETAPAVPADIRNASTESRNHSDESLGLHKSVASSLLTEDSDSETP